MSQRHVPDVLRNAGHIVHLQREQFATGAQDVEWLPVVGANRWVLITKDERIRKRPLELKAFVGAKVRAFVMTMAGEMTGADQGELIGRALKRIVLLAAKTKPPFLANITASGNVELIQLRKLS